MEKNTFENRFLTRGIVAAGNTHVFPDIKKLLISYDTAKYLSSVELSEV